jgi:hypothetical protein
VNRIEIETKLNEGRNWLLAKFGALSDEQLLRPLTKSEHDPENRWSALDHLAHLALIEGSFNGTVQRHVAGHHNPVGLLHDDQGEPRTRDQIGAIVHAQTEEWQIAHHDDSYNEVVALTSAARGATLLLLSELSDAQLEEVIPGAPWADGTVGAVLATNADHGRMHWKWIEEAGLLGGG